MNSARFYHFYLKVLCMIIKDLFGYFSDRMLDLNSLINGGIANFIFSFSTWLGIILFCVWKFSRSCWIKKIARGLLLLKVKLQLLQLQISKRAGWCFIAILLRSVVTIRDATLVELRIFFIGHLFLKSRNSLLQLLGNIFFIPGPDGHSLLLLFGWHCTNEQHVCDLLWVFLVELIINL